MDKILIGTIYNIGCLIHWIEEAKREYNLQDDCEISIEKVNEDCAPQLFYYRNNITGYCFLSLE